MRDKVRNELGKEVYKILSNKLQLTWHHHEDLKTIQLIPWAIHDKVAHLGGFKIAEDLRNTSKKYYYKWLLYGGI